MKKHFLFILMMFMPLIACAADYDAKVGKIYYNFNTTDMTAQVTCMLWDSRANSTAYSGDVVIPSEVCYNNITYRVTSIGKWAFLFCRDLTSVIIPNSVTSIGIGAFEDCTGLTSVNIPNSVISIADGAFDHCQSLKSIIVESGNPNYDSRDNCNAIIETSTNRLMVGSNNSIIPNGVVSISRSAFWYRSGLTSVTIPKSVKSIGSSAFEGCSGLTSVHITDLEAWCKIDMVSMGSNPLNWAHHLLINGKEVTNLIIPSGVSSLANTFSGCSGLTSVTIPNSVTSIGYSTFENCTGLTSITIPNSVTSIRNDAFNGCTGLTSITVDGGNTKYDSRDNCNAIIEKSSNTLVAGCKNTIIPKSVTSIGNYAFSGCSGLTSVTIPNSVTNIRNDAFCGCTGLTSIVSLNNTPPSCTQNYYGDYDQFESVDKTNCVIWVPKGCSNAYKEANGWKDFTNIRELTFGDVNIDFEVDENDLNATTSHIMGKEPDGFYENLADLNGDEKVNATDVVKLVTILNIQDGLSTDWQMNYNNSQLVSSLTCTLNNDGVKTIQLTKCELYCNQSLVSSSNFKVTLASGKSKKCSFDDLASYGAKTGFSVVWHYTYNGETYSYRCNLTE